MGGCLYFVYMTTEYYYSKKFILGVYQNYDEAVRRQYEYLGSGATKLQMKDVVGSFVDFEGEKYWSVSYIRIYNWGDQFTCIV